MPITDIVCSSLCTPDMVFLTHNNVLFHLSRQVQETIKSNKSAGVQCVRDQCVPVTLALKHISLRHSNHSHWTESRSWHHYFDLCPFETAQLWRFSF